MKHLSEYRDKHKAKYLIDAICAQSKTPVRLMEVCGSHTVSIFRHGIRQMLPQNIQLISGPGCPVCVTAKAEIDQAIKLSTYPDVVITTFGDMIRVPGSLSSLQKERAMGADLRIVYSSFDALKIAIENPKKKVVFLGIGFETTAPAIAATVLEACRMKLDNFYILSAHKLLPPALTALLNFEQLNIQGFIYPGHVTTIIGTFAYEQIAGKYNIPGVVCGFEPVDILETILLLIKQIEQGKIEVEIQYKRGTSATGNPRAMDVLNQVFNTCDSNWRGLGLIPGSGLTLRDEYRSFAAEDYFDLKVSPGKDHPECLCSEVICGVKTPTECKLYSKACTPQNPVGPCMVSTEGTCAAYYKYHN